MEYILKNGSPRFQQDLRHDMYKISLLSNFSTLENGVDKGASIRERATLITDLLTSPQRLEDERAQAR